MNDSNIRIRKRHIPPPTQVETTDIHEIIDLLLSGTPLNHVPLNLQSKLLAPLTAKKNECLIAGKIDEARRINDLILEISLAYYRRPKEELRKRPETRSSSQSCRLPTIRALSAKSPSSETQEIQYHTDVLSLEKYWKNEIQLYNERRQQAFNYLEKRQQEEMNDLIIAGTPKNIKTRVTSASQLLRQRESKIKSAEQVAKLRERVTFIEAFDVEQRSSRIAASLAQQKMQLQARHDFEKVTLERQWKEKWDNLQSDMKNDLQQRSIHFSKSGLGKTLPTKIFLRTKI